MTIKTAKRNVGPLSMRGAVGTVDDARRTVEVVFSTGAAVLRNSYFDGPSYETLSMDPKHVRMGRLENGAPFLSDHSARLANVIGVVESARLEGGKGFATIRFAKAEDDAAADQIYRKVRDGLITGVSVGYRTYRSEKVEGGDAAIPTFRAVDWEPYEISAVALPADASAGFRSADDAEQNECDFVTLSRSHTDCRHPGEKMDPEELKRIEAEKVAAAQRAEAAALAARAEGQRLERERQSKITSAFRSFGGSQQTHAAKLAEMIAGEATAEQAREYVLEELAKASDAQPNVQHTSGIERGEEDGEKFRRGVSDAMLQRVEAVRTAIGMKLPGYEKIGDGGSFRGMRLSDIARECARRAGHKTEGIYSVERVIELALTQRNGYATPSDFPVLFEDIARKTLEAAYGVQALTWQRFVGVRNVSDFKDSSFFQRGSLGTLPVVPPGAEYKNIALPDGAKMVINTETRGAIIALDRHAIINDDLGALTNVASELGGMFADTIEEQAYAFLATADGLGPTVTRNGATAAFFSTTFANLSTGAALSGAALSLDRAHMRRQRDISGNKVLDLMPRILMVPLALEDLARSINTDTYEQGTANTQQKNNQQKGMFSDIITKPTAPVLTGTKRYLFTEDKGAILCVFGPGGNGPTLSSQDGFRRDGVEYKVRIDFKINAGDPKKALHNVGQ